MRGLVVGRPGICSSAAAEQVAVGVVGVALPTDDPRLVGTGARAVAVGAVGVVHAPLAQQVAEHVAELLVLRAVS